MIGNLRSFRCAPVKAAVLLALSIAACGCGGSTAGTLPSGRMVSASSDTLWMSQSNAKDTATLSLGPTTVVVGPTQVTIDGKPVATLSARVKAVAVKRADRRVSIVADGTTIYNAPLMK